ncbi:MAG: adenylyltransferase/cytidyltransferase family protein [Victivallaceae bacterium]|nr:adenylyltransferase/cytidyltransferase family protein [Victivallaceae bacterium]
MVRNPATLVMTLGEAVKWREALRVSGKTLAVTNGCFDIMHRGHAEYLYQSRELAGALLVLINSDASVRALKGPTRPIIPEEHRAYMLASLEAVDAVVVFDSARCDAELAALAPDIYVKGGDYTPESLDPRERAALLTAGTEIVIKPFIPGFSTTDIIRRIKG